MFRAKLSRATILVLGLALSACGSLLESDEPAPQAWWLEPPALPAADGGVDAGPLVLRFAVAPGLDSEAIMSLDPDGRFSPFAGAMWVDRLPELLESLLSRSLAASGRYSRVGEWSASSESPCRLNLEAVRFHAKLDAARQARSVEVAFDGRYRCAGDASRNLSASASVPVTGNRMPEVVAAFQQALDTATGELAAQL